MLNIFLYPPLSTPSFPLALCESSPFAWTTTTNLSLWVYFCLSTECSPQSSRSDLYKNMNYVTDFLKAFPYHSWNKILTWPETSIWFGLWQLIPVFLPGKFHGLRILIGYSPWGCKESDTTERLHCRWDLILYSLPTLPPCLTVWRLHWLSGYSGSCQVCFCPRALALEILSAGSVLYFDPPQSAPTHPSNLSFNSISLRGFLWLLYLNLKWSTVASLLFPWDHLLSFVIMLSVLFTSALSFSSTRL